MREIIEDTISRNKKFQKERQLRVEKLKQLKAPPELIEYEEVLAKMTVVEYEIFCQERAKEFAIQKSEYAKNNIIQKSVVDEIYQRESMLDYNPVVYSSDVAFSVRLDPLSFISKEDYDNDLYQTFLDHAREIYLNRYSNKHNTSRK